MNSEIEKLIDGLWNISFTRVAGKETPVLRSVLGDRIDVIVPQSRILSMIEANPSLASLLYHAAYYSANRNAYIITRKLNMPADYFWKYEFWPRERAFPTLQKVINRIFSAIIKGTGEGFLDLKDTEPEQLRFTLVLKECAECAGIISERNICYYHAGTFAGILSSLMGKEMDCFEADCSGTGQEGCAFTAGKREDPEIGVQVTDFLSPRPPGIKDCFLHAKDKRSDQEKMVTLEYYQLLIANSLLSNPGLFATAGYHIGVELGRKLALEIKSLANGDPLKRLQEYYREIRHSEIVLTREGEEITAGIRECAETATGFQKKEMVSFVVGEIQGALSVLTDKDLTARETGFEGGMVRIKYSPQV